MPASSMKSADFCGSDGSMKYGTSVLSTSSGSWNATMLSCAGLPCIGILLPIHNASPRRKSVAIRCSLARLVGSAATEGTATLAAGPTRYQPSD